MADVTIENQNLPSVENQSPQLSSQYIENKLLSLAKKVSVTATQIISTKTGNKFDEKKQSLPEFLIKAKDIIQEAQSKEQLKKDIDDFRVVINSYRTIFTNFLCPIQLITGVMLKRLKELCNNDFLVEAKKMFPDLSVKTRENYMNAADILDYPELRKYVTIGLTPLYRLSNVIKKKKVNPDSIHVVAELFKDIAKNETISEEAYDLAVNYIILKEEIEKYCTINPDIYYEMFKLGFDLIPKDAAFIAKANKGDGEFANKYFSNILAFGQDREKAMHVTLGLKEGEKVEKFLAAKSFPFDRAVSILGETADKIITSKSSLKKDQLESLKNLIDKLNNIYQNSKGEN